VYLAVIGIRVRDHYRAKYNDSRRNEDKETSLKPAMEIQLNNIIVGSIETARHAPTAEPTIGGFNLTIPITIRLAPTGNPPLYPMVSHLRATININACGIKQEIGTCSSPHLFTSASTSYDIAASLHWRGTLETLAAFEQQRNGEPLIFSLQISGHITLLTFTPGETFQLTSPPQAFHGQELLTISTEAWASILQTLRIIDLILVQIPLATTTAAQMTRVWNALQAARKDFTSGGETAWRAAGVHIREALSAWQDAAPPDTGNYPKDRSAMTKDQRLDQLRQSLREFTHLAGHPDPMLATSWTRDDALLALSTISALLNAKKP
jgi:hypothetical protein